MNYKLRANDKVRFIDPETGRIHDNVGIFIKSIDHRYCLVEWCKGYVPNVVVEKDLILHN
jgi:hypothetical protein